MQHSIIFKDQPQVAWQEALPLGNGKFGVLVYASAVGLELSFNHYDVYYEKVSRPKDFSKSKTYQEQVAPIAEMSDDFRYANSYIYARNETPDTYAPLYSHSTMPKFGTGQLRFSEGVKLETLRLNIDDGELVVTLQKGDDRLTCTLIVTPDDEFIIYGVRLGEFISEVSLAFLPEADSHEVMTSATMGEISGDGYHAFVKSAVTDFIPQNDHQFSARLRSDAEQATYQFLAETPLKKWETVQAENTARWHKFFASSVTLPDKMLENLWFLYNYTLKISCGAGSLNFKEACGLSGLWNVKNDYLWGSMWYWDVNIQAAFWGAASSGHLDLLHQFNESYLAHATDIKNYSQNVYGSEDWALDYPHTFYNCIQPWCAQFLIEEYDYTKDADFLARILPVLQAQCDFAVAQFLRADGTVHIPYDIAPEQGPLTENSTITLACLRYLFKKTIDFLQVIKQTYPSSYDAFLNGLPDYAQTPERLLDSPHTRAEQWLRHPSLLMPIFPLREENFLPGGKKYQQAQNTVDYVFNNCEIGMFGFGWIASAYAQLGLGDNTIYTLYEKGIDQWMHTNGLPYEESERFMNLTIITKPPIYLPAMMEPMGELTRSINELLYHSETGQLLLFPALPQGKIFAPHMNAASEKSDRQFVSEAWQDVAFKNLALKSGHRISAEVADGQLVSVKIVAGATEQLNITLGVPTRTDFPASVSLQAGETFVWGKAKTPEIAPLEIAGPLVHVSQTHRHIFLGKNKETAYFKAMDAFMCPYLMGNTYQYPMTTLKFDFGEVETKKNYTDVFNRQVNLSVPQAVLATTYRRIAADSLSDGRMGFTEGTEKKAVHNERFDSLRQDALISEAAEIFALNMPQGKYSLLFGIGGAAEKTTTTITINDCTKTIALSGNDFTTVEWPLMHDGGNLIIHLSAGTDPWCLNFLLVNKDRTTY